MPYTFEIDQDLELVRETWTGRVDIAQFKDSCLKEWTHLSYKPRIAMISDFRSATAAIDIKDVVQFAMWFGDKDPPKRHAIVVKREQGFGFAKLFGVMSDAAKHERNATKVFHSLDEAESWVGLKAGK